MGLSSSDSERGLVELARTDPRSALTAGAELLGSISHDEHADRSLVLRALGIAARGGSTLSEAISFGSEAVTEAELSGENDLIAEALMTLAGSMALSGDNDRALALLERAGRVASGRVAAQIAFQKGSVLLRLGEAGPALDCYDLSLRFFKRHPDPVFEAMILNNRGMIHLRGGKTSRATDDLTRARTTYDNLGYWFEVAAVDHNLGLAAAMVGDIPQALNLLDDSEQRLSDLLGSAAEIQVSRIEVLLSAGLFREAFGLAAEIGPTSARGRAGRG